MPVTEAQWRAANRAHWDELVGLHLGPSGYDLTRLRSGGGHLDPLVAGELPALVGKRVLHLQCHFGADTLALAQLGSDVVGLDFSAPAIAAARRLATELGLSERAHFVETDLYDALAAVPHPHEFDLVFASWGAICWLPDLGRWASIAAAMLRPGGRLYLADGHPAALVLDDAAAGPDGIPGFLAPYSANEPWIETDTRDYIDDEAELGQKTTYVWIHPLGEIVTSVIEAGLRLDWLHEHDRVPWRMFRILVRETDRFWRWPGTPWLPLTFSLAATKGG